MKRARSMPRSPGPPSTAVAERFEANILRLARSVEECEAIEAGQVDAVVDPVSGRAILLPKAQAALLERKSRFRSLVDLSSDGYWEQDEHHRFVVHEGIALGREGGAIIGKHLWDLPFDGGADLDWQAHRTQLEWRAIFRDLELRYIDSAGALRVISISGEPMFDAESQFTGYRGITREITAREPPRIALPASARFAHATLEALSAPVCVLDAVGLIVGANAAWRALASLHGAAAERLSEGENYLATCESVIARVDAIAMVAGIRQVIAGEREVFRYEYPSEASGVQRWFMATVSQVSAAAPARAIVTYADISDLKRTEQLLRLECLVARCLAEAADTAIALKAVMRALCETERWDCGRYFRLDPATGVFHLQESWGTAARAVEQFMAKSRDAMFRPGAGVAGSASQSGAPRWLLSESADEQASHIALAHEIYPEVGLKGAFTFPVIAGDTTIGVFAFASHCVREPDDRLLQALRNIGAQVSSFLERRRAEATLRDSETRFRRLTELSADWCWQQDAVGRFTSVVGPAMLPANDMLGRTLWELPTLIIEAEQLVRHRSELAAQWSFCDFEFAALHPDGQLGYYRISGEPLYDDDGLFIGFHGTGVDITQLRRTQMTLADPAA